MEEKKIVQSGKGMKKELVLFQIQKLIGSSEVGEMLHFETLVFEPLQSRFKAVLESSISRPSSVKDLGVILT